MRGNGVMTIAQIRARIKSVSEATKQAERELQGQLRHHRVMASVIVHELTMLPKELMVEDDANPFDEDIPAGV
jgi:hypothetical protein